MEQDFFLAGAMFGAGFFSVGGFAVFVGYVLFNAGSTPEQRSQLTREVRLQKIRTPKRASRTGAYLDRMEAEGRESA